MSESHTETEPIRVHDLLTPGVMKSVIKNLNLDYRFPRWCEVRQRFDTPYIDNLGTAVRLELRKEAVRQKIKPGARIAVGVGSRHIAHQDEIVKHCIDELKAMGAAPFIIPAMGSHGGATAEGQAEVLAGYGITEATMGVPVNPSMEVEEIGTIRNGTSIYVAKTALEADAVVVVARVKPHTAFRGPIESGLCKMLAIGLGKQRGAQSMHRVPIVKFDWMIPEAARLVISRLNIIAGLAIIENAQAEVGHVEAVPAAEILSREPELLNLAREWMPQILTDHIDLLLVDQLGKDISGDGMDPNVTGRYLVPEMHGGPSVQKIVVRDLTELTHGNCNGVGVADIITRTVLEKTDFRPGYTNGMTSTVVTGVRVPPVMETDRDAIALGLNMCNDTTPPEARVVRIRNTVELSRIWVSEAVLRDEGAARKFEVLTPLQEMAFDAEERLLDPR